MAYLAGKFGSIGIGGTAVPASDFTVTTSSDTPDTTNFFDGGFESHAVGMWSGEITFTAMFAGVAYPDEGDVITINILAYTGGPSVTFNNCRITSLEWTNDAKDVQKVKITAQTSGAFSFTV